MCARAYETYTDEELYIRYLSRKPIAGIPHLSPVYNLCPTMDSPVLRLLDGERRFDRMYWQLIPDWSATFKTSLSTVNTRSETVFDSTLYRPLIFRQRCIIPLSGFFEWKADGKRKRPFKIHLKDEPIMSVAGIWSAWKPGTTEERWSFSILTTEANTFMREIHDRMPVILDRSDEQDWLDPEIHEQQSLEVVMKPCPSSWLTAVEVSPLVNSAANNVPEVLDPSFKIPQGQIPLQFD